MGDAFEVEIPDLGGAGDVRVIELLVEPGDEIAADQGLLTLESDKASMDVPSPRAGRVVEVVVREGDEVHEGDVVVRLELAENASEGDGEARVGGSDQDPANVDTGADGADAPQPEAPHPDAPQTGAPPARSRRPGEVDRHAPLLVVGGGPGGYAAAFRAADLGLEVVLVERYDRLGGVCLNVGCIPSKAYLHVARVLEESRDLVAHGVSFGEPEIDVAGLRSFKDGVVTRLTGGLSQLAERRGVTVVQGEASFISPDAVEVETASGTETISFNQAIVAAGSRVTKLPGLPWDDPRVMDSTDALEIEEIPERLLVVGGGIIGLEMATVYASLGSRLTVVELLDGLIPGCDRDLVRPLARRLEERFGAALHVSTRLEGLDAHPDRLVARLVGDEAPEMVEIDRVLVAVGRRPNGDRIGAEAAGLRVDDRGYLLVDGRQRTNLEHIFAIGDITGEPMLAHKATHEGKTAAEVAAGERSAFDARVIPSVAYTDPEIAWVGLTETVAKRDGIAYGKGSFPWAASGRSLGMGRDDGLTKILFDPATRRVLGAGIVGPGAGELIAELTLAIEMGCEAADLALTIHPHPTLSETTAFASEAFEGTIIDLYQPRR